MMKRLFLLVCLCVGLSTIATAQQFKHFKIDTSKSGNHWTLYPITKRPLSGVNKMRADPKKHIMILIFNAIHSFPEEIKKELIKYDGRISVGFYFNAKGEIFYVYFSGRIEKGIPLTEEQWLEIVQIIKRIKIDLTQIDVLDGLEWGVGGIYHITSVLRGEVDMRGMVKHREKLKP